MAVKNKSENPIECTGCGEDIAPGEVCHKDRGDLICELCYEERHEYDND